MVVIREFVAARGGGPFGRWVSQLDRHAAARVATALYRMEMGNLSNAKGVGGGMLEYRIDSVQATGSTSDGMVTR